MTGLKTVYSKDGTPITDLKVSVVSSSLLNAIGEAVFYVAKSSPKCRNEVLKWGNYIVVQRSGDLDDWVGVLDTPRPWHNGYVEVHAFDPVYLLDYRPAPLNATISGTAGEKFEKLLAIANGQEDTLIRAGEIFYGGGTSDEIVNDSVYAHLKKIRENAGHDWICTPEVGDQGRLTITMDWLEKAGVETDLELSQGHNIVSGDSPLEESGQIINAVEAVSSLDAGGLVTTYVDEIARAENGLRKVRKVFNGIASLDALLAAAKTFVDAQKAASVSTPLTAVNVGRTFANIRRGNMASYRYSKDGFNGDGLGQSAPLRISGYRFNESDGTCEIFSGDA